jgi:hypothetical protein
VGKWELTCMLIRARAPWLVNLPIPFQFVDCRVDPEREGVFFIIRSGSFPRIARGTLIPEFDPGFNGLKYC